MEWQLFRIEPAVELSSTRPIVSGGNHNSKTAIGPGAICSLLGLLLLLPNASSAQEAGSTEERLPESDEYSRIESKDAKNLDVVIVTGTRIRGGTTPSPVITLGSERIREEGFSDLGDVIRSIPQNAGGGQNPGVGAGATAGAGGLGNQNVTGGSSLNLRGLGADATLTLVNGRRMAYGGFTQGVDISAIPLEAVERIEIVADGASAIYGSDAVGGVGNVILKREFEGVSVGARHGGATEGGLTTREYTATAGATWESGGLVATFKDASVDAIEAGQRGYTAHLAAPTTIYPASDTRSGLMHAYQRFGEVAELQLLGVRSERQQLSYFALRGNNRVSPETVTTLLAPSLELALPGEWSMSLAGSWGKDEHLQIQSRLGLATGRVRTCYCNESRAYEIGAEGPVFALPGDPARMAVGTGYRTNSYLQFNHLSGTEEAAGEEGTRFAYAELAMPWITPGMGIRGARRLDVTAAARLEDYSSFGSVTTPKLGVVYSPGTDFTFKASWGRSFKAPTLLQRYYGPFQWLDLASFYGADAPDATVLFVSGGSRDLKPERARTVSSSLVFHPEALRGMEAELTWFDIDYTDRVVEPVTDYDQALIRPEYAPFIQRAPSAAAQAAFLSGATDFSNFTGAPYDPDDVVAIIFGQQRNASRQRIRGLDLAARHGFDAGAGRLTVRGSVSWLDITQQILGSERSIDVSGTLYNPAEVRGRLGAVYGVGGFTASVFGNHVSGVTNMVTGGKTASFTTFDTTLRYRTHEGAGLLAGVDLGLSVHNLLNRAPPLHVVADPLGGRQSLPYDSTNYSAVGRFASLSITKSW